jgi:hypothetical protein
MVDTYHEEDNSEDFVMTNQPNIERDKADKCYKSNRCSSFDSNSN